MQEFFDDSNTTKTPISRLGGVGDEKCHDAAVQANKSAIREGPDHPAS
jgi:hypothetical protein